MADLSSMAVLTNRAGNYDSYLRTRAELEDAQMKKHRWEQDQISHMKEYIARFGHGSAKLARQAQSKEKTLEKMVSGAHPAAYHEMGDLPHCLTLLSSLTGTCAGATSRGAFITC